VPLHCEGLYLLPCSFKPCLAAEHFYHHNPAVIYFQQFTLLNRIWFVLPMTPIQGILRDHRQNIKGRLHQMFFNGTVSEGQSDQQGRNKLYTGDQLEQRNRRT
jgi:hypothetical protein